MALQNARTSLIHHVMERCSPFVKEGTRIRLGMEGDPCYAYRSTEDAPRGTVRSLSREDDILNFELKLDEGDTIRLDNMSTHPRKTWEIEPEHAPTFRKAVLDSGDYLPLEHEGDKEASLVESKVAVLDDTFVPDDPKEYMESVEKGIRDHLAEMEERFRRAETDAASKLRDELRDVQEEFRKASQEQKHFHKTIADTVRHLSTDLMCVAGRKPLQYAPQYAQRYDASVDEYRASSGPQKKSRDQEDEGRRGVMSGDKYSFDYREICDDFT